MMELRQAVAGSVLGVALIVLVLRLIQSGRLDIAYCWLWLAVGASVLAVVIRYDWLVALSDRIGSATPTTTLFLFGIFFLLLMSLQMSLVVSAHRRQLKKLNQQLALALHAAHARDAARTPGAPGL